MAGSKKKKPTMSITQPPPKASLIGIPPELRNMIYQHVVDDIKEVNFSIRKLTKPDPKDSHLGVDERLRQSLSRHPLSQTCRQLGAEFDPVHQHKAFTEGVRYYNFDAENYDLDCLGELAEILPSTVLHSMDLGTKFRCRVRFLLNADALASVLELEKRASTLGRISRDSQKLESATRITIYNMDVVLLFRRKVTPVARRRTCLTHKDERSTMIALKNLVQTVTGISTQRQLGYTSDVALVRRLCFVHREANRSHQREQEVVRAIETRKRMEIAHTKKIKDELRKALEGKSQMEKLITLEEFLDGA